MKKLYILLTSLVISSLSFAQTSDLYFSMYGEGSSNNKWVEIYNGTGSDVDLSDYSVELYANGAATATNTEALSGILADGDVYVIYNGSAAPGITANGDLSSSVTFFNGDDAVALLNMGTVIDVIGEIGADPGSSWDVGSTTGGTANHTLVRKNTVCDPNPTNLDSFGTDDATSEWIVYGIDEEWGQIGSHFACSTAPNLSITAPTEGFVYMAGTANATISIDVQNFNVANGTGDGHIHYTVNGGGVNMKFDTLDFDVPVSDGNSYTLYMELVDNGHVPIVPAVNATVNFSVSLPCANNVGDIIITEIMQNPSAVSDASGEWFEVYNTTGAPIDMNGWELSDSGSNFHVIASSLVVPANGYAVLGNNADNMTNGDVDVDYEYSSYTLGNSSDSIILTCSGSIIDEVAWDNGATFPDPNGASMELALEAFDNVSNDDGSNWGQGVTPYGDGDLGTPGAANDFTLSIDQFEVNGFKMYPNPNSSGQLTIISSANDIFKISVFDVLGKQVINTSVSNGNLDISELNSGLYIVKISQGNSSISKKLVIN